MHGPEISPRVKLKHLLSLTDDIGIMQHAKFSIPLRMEGYTTDDNARGLVLGTLLSLKKDSNIGKRLMKKCLSFILMMQRPNGRIRNLLGYDRSFLDLVGSDDCLGRTLWACGSVIERCVDEKLSEVAKEIFDKALPWIWKTNSPRAKALAIIGLCRYLRAYPGDQALSEGVHRLVSDLVRLYNSNASSSWEWFEPYLTYGNARIPEALVKSCLVDEDSEVKKTALSSMEFLSKVEGLDEVFSPVGNRGWYERGGDKAVYDQQPLEAFCEVSANLAAFQLTHEDKYRMRARNAWLWFSGRNIKRLPLCDPKTGGCFDGLTADGVNQNQGAESTLSYLLSTVLIRDILS